MQLFWEANCALSSSSLIHTNENPTSQNFFFTYSHMSTIGRWWCINPTFIFFNIIQRRFITYLTFEDLFVGLPKIFREERVYDRIHRRIAVSQTVRCYSEEKRSLSQWENSKFSPEVDYMMWQPGYPKNHYHHQYSLSCLKQKKKIKYITLLTPEQEISNVPQKILKEKKHVYRSL